MQIDHFTSSQSKISLLCVSSDKVTYRTHIIFIIVLKVHNIISTHNNN